MTEIYAEVDEIRLATVLLVIDSVLDGWRLVRMQGAVNEEGLVASGTSRISAKWPFSKA